MAQFLKFKILITFKLNFNWGQLKNISKYGYFKKWEKSHIKIVNFEDKI